MDYKFGVLATAAAVALVYLAELSTSMSTEASTTALQAIKWMAVDSKTEFLNTEGRSEVVILKRQGNQTEMYTAEMSTYQATKPVGGVDTIVTSVVVMTMCLVSTFFP